LVLGEFYTNVMPPTSAELQQIQAQHVGLMGSYILAKWTWNTSINTAEANPRCLAHFFTLSGAYPAWHEASPQFH